MTEYARPILIKILLRHLYSKPSGVSRRQCRAMGRAEPKYHTNRGGPAGFACRDTELEVTCVPWWDPQAHAPLCQRSEVNGNISPLSGLRGRDIELLIQPRITHDQITASNNPPTKSSAQTLSISIWEAAA